MRFLGLAAALLFASTLAAQPKGDPGAEAKFRSADGKELSYRLVPPKKVESGVKYPLVVCLHGIGGGTSAPKALAAPAMQDKYPCFVMVPRAGEGNCWAKVSSFSRIAERPEALPTLVEAIKSILAKEPIDPARVYVTGQSMGGMGSWGAIARHPDLFAAAVPVCGAWDVKEVEKMKSVPVWAFHGDKDTTVPTRFSRELTDALKKAGGTVKYTEYAGVSHNSWDKTYAEADMWKWMFEQKKSK